jgi:hypothetical protein
MSYLEPVKECSRYGLVDDEAGSGTADLSTGPKGPEHGPLHDLVNLRDQK